MAAVASPSSQNAQQLAVQQRRQMLRSFRNNTRKRHQTFAFTNGSISAGNVCTAILPQTGMASRVWLYFDITFSDAAAAPACTKLARGPFNFVKNLRLWTNLGSNNIWDCDGFHTHMMNLEKGIVQGRYDLNVDNGYDSSTTDYANDPWFQYPAVTVQNKVYHVRFVLRVDVSVNDKINFAQGLLNLQAPQLQTMIYCTLGQASDLYATTDTITLGGTVTAAYEYYEIPNPQRQVALPSGILHCTLEQNVPFATTGRVPWQIVRQGKLLRLLQETYLNGARAEGGTTTDQSTDGNPATAGIDAYELKINNSDIIYYKPYWLKAQTDLEEFPYLARFMGCTLHEFFDAVSLPSSGDKRDWIDTEAVTTTEFATYINSAATLGSNNNYFNFTREILVPFGGYGAGPQNPAAMGA